MAAVAALDRPLARGGGGVVGRGLVLPAPGEVRYLDARPEDDPALALKRMSAPDPVPVYTPLPVEPAPLVPVAETTDPAATTTPTETAPTTTTTEPVATETVPPPTATTTPPATTGQTG